MLFLAALAVAASAAAAGTDSRTYTCGGGSLGSRLQRRSVATTDNPECVVNYCRPVGGTTGSN